MKTLQHVWLILLSGLLFMSCGEHQNDQPTADDTPPEVTEPEIIISVEEAETLFKNYGDRRVSLIEEFQNVDADGNPIDPDSDAYVQATRSLSIDYKTLKQYMAFVEKQAGSAKTDITGLRVYFGLYGPKGEYPNSETVFLNPLMEFGKPNNIRDDVSFAIQEVNGSPTAVAVGEILGLVDEPTQEQKKGGTNLEMKLQGGSVQSLAGNRMPKRPPPPPPIDPDYQ